MSAEKEIRAALEAGPTPGPWKWHTDQNMYGPLGPPVAPDYEYLGEPIITTDGGHYGPDKQCRAYIAACNPANLTELLADIDSLRVENEGLRRDAERLDFLESSKANTEHDEADWIVDVPWRTDRDTSYIYLGDTLREAIDAALSKGGEA